MATYHVSADGNPRACEAQPGNCPIGSDDNHFSSLEAAKNHAEKTLAAEHGGSFGGQHVERYIHPQGKVIEIDSQGNLRAFKNGKEMTTSATVEKLRAGYGAWTRNDSLEPLPPLANSHAQERGAQDDPIVPGVKPEDVSALLSSAAQKSEIERKGLAAAHATVGDYDKKHAIAEGRAFYYGRGGAGKIYLTEPYTGPEAVFYERKPENQAIVAAAHAKYGAALQEEEETQTRIEKSGLGHMIPDKGHTIRVRNQAQKILLTKELQGQISDGKWENLMLSRGNREHWEDWSNAKVVVDPKNLGRNFHPIKDNYQLNAKDLLDVVGDRMIESVQKADQRPNYNERAMGEDLRELRTIFKTHRATI